MKLALRAAALAAALALAHPASAQHAARQGSGDGAGAHAAAIDARTNQLRAPTREEVEALARAVGAHLTQDPSAVTRARLADGTQLLGLDETWMNVSVAVTRGGEVEARCVESAAEAKAFAEAPGAARPASSPPALEER